MPIYEYKCTVCEKPFEYWAETMTDQAEACPDCGSDQIKKQLSAFSSKVSRGSMPDCGASCPTSSCPASGGGCAGGSCPL
jgi:putative FmdB family regulatory protein